MQLLRIIGAMIAVIGVALVAIAHLKHCRLPRRKPRIWKEAAVALLTVAAFASVARSNAAESSFLANVSLAPLGVVNIDPSDGGKEWGAGLKVGYRLSDKVSLNLGLLAYEDWKGSAIDETPVEVKAILFGSASKGANLYAIGGVDRSWRYDDWGMKGGLGLEFRLAKQLSVFGEATYDVWNHGPDRIQVPFGLRLAF